MTDYINLYLENIVIPEDYSELAKTGGWEYNDDPVFRLSIKESPDGVCYRCDIMAFGNDGEDMRAIRGEIEFAGYVPFTGASVNGHCWEVFLKDDLKDNYPELCGAVTIDSDPNVCRLTVMNSLDDFKAMLKALSDTIRTLNGARYGY